VQVEGWDRSHYYEDTKLPWVLPSPNMPTPDTAVVYPGMCLLEATNVSEGRGTTRPFEIFGAPWIDPYKLCEALEGYKLDGVLFRPLYFRPTFNKYHHELCGGAQIHVTDRTKFRPVKMAVCLLHFLLAEYRDQFRWKEPPYEFEYNRLPIDILFGNSWIRETLESGSHPDQIEAGWQSSLQNFIAVRKNFLLY
jgi:uncharacterized protein YbbC (DUF1343 family)